VFPVWGWFPLSRLEDRKPSGINTIWRIGDMENCVWGVSCIESNNVWYNNEYEEMTNTDKGNTIASLSLSTANPAHLLTLDVTLAVLCFLHFQHLLQLRLARPLRR